MKRLVVAVNSARWRRRVFRPRCAHPHPQRTVAPAPGDANDGRAIGIDDAVGRPAVIGADCMRGLLVATNALWRRTCPEHRLTDGTLGTPRVAHISFLNNKQPLAWVAWTIALELAQLGHMSCRALGHGSSLGHILVRSLVIRVTSAAYGGVDANAVLRPNCASLQPSPLSATARFLLHSHVTQRTSNVVEPQSSARHRTIRLIAT
jgi:hypothetical protein